MKEILEAGMLICFGISWPVSLRKAWRSRTAQGVSEVFLWLIAIGYALGLAGKLLFNPNYVVAVYVFNLTMVLLNLAVFYRNKRLDRQAPMSPPEG